MLLFRHSRLRARPGVIKYIIIVCALSAGASVTNYVGKLELTPFGIRKKTDIWSTSTKEVTFSLVFKSAPVASFRMERAYIYSALTADLNHFATDIRDGASLGGVRLGIYYPDMTPYRIQVAEMAAREDNVRVPVENQLIVEVPSPNLASEKQWDLIIKRSLRPENDTEAPKMGLYKEGAFLEFDRYNRYVSGVSTSSQTLLRRRTPHIFSFIKCIDNMIALCTTYVDLDAHIALQVHSVNILRTKNIALHEAQIRAVLLFLKEKKIS
jgi:hypothetical protein